jgi:hypothetical protein
MEIPTIFFEWFFFYAVSERVSINLEGKILGCSMMHHEYYVAAGGRG